MEKPVLVVMAAGMGSRYGGLKQIDPVGANGQLIIDYSIYDARRAGFETVVFVIKRELAEQFRAAIGDRLSRVIEVKYAYQELEDLPAGYGVPEGRVKPWGTCRGAGCPEGGGRPLRSYQLGRLLRAGGVPGDIPLSGGAPGQAGVL